MFRITVAADPTDLTTLATVKADLGITTTTEDVYLRRQIKAASRRVRTYLRCPVAVDGTNNLGLETIVETFDRCNWFAKREMMLARKWVKSIDVLTFDGVAVSDITGIRFDYGTGMVSRIPGAAVPVYFPTYQAEITYQAGFILPPDGDADLPEDIEQAVIDIIRMTRAGQTRDRSVKAVEVFDVDRTEYFWGNVAGAGGQTDLPPDISTKLDEYCYEPV